MEALVREAIESDAAELAKNIRRVCRDQKAIWQEIPHWAYLADGRSGWSGSYQTAYRFGFWDVFGASRHIDGMMVINCATGEINLGLAPAPDSHVLRFAWQLDLLDAAATLGRLIRNSQRPIIPNRGAGYTTEEELTTYKLRQGYRSPARPFVRQPAAVAS